MVYTIARLKTSKMRYDERIRQQGIKMGKSWATASAGFHELRRLADASDSVFDWCIDGEQTNSRLHKQLLSIICRDAECPNGRRLPFWERAIGYNREYLLAEPVFLRSFVEGAVYVFNAVRDQI